MSDEYGCYAASPLAGMKVGLVLQTGHPPAYIYARRSIGGGSCNRRGGWGVKGHFVTKTDVAK